MVRPASFINGIKSGVWSKEEDDTLRAFVQKNGHRNWQKLPYLAGLARTGKSCRLRWVNYLQPGLKKGSFSKEEEDLIIRLHNKLGNKWSAIAENLPGRTDNDIKNHWHAHIKKRCRFVTRAEEQSVDEMNCFKESNDQTENTNLEAYDDRLLKRAEELNDFGFISNSSDNEFSSLGLTSHIHTPTSDVITYVHQLMNDTEFPAFPDEEQFLIDDTLNMHLSPFISQFSTLGLCNNHTPTFSADSSDGSGGIAYDDHTCFNQLPFPFPEEYYSDFGLCHNHTPITSADSVLQGSFW